jgi:hypothetical protein
VLFSFSGRKGITECLTIKRRRRRRRRNGGKEERNVMSVVDLSFR